MQRKIKFRIWDKENQNWLSEIWHNSNSIFDLKNGVVEYFRNEDRLILQQYTGLKDKNDLEIYEGDIVRFNDPVELSDGLFLSTLYLFEFYNGSFLRPYIYQSINGSKFVNLTDKTLFPTGRAKLKDNPHFDLTKAEVVGNMFETPFQIDR